MKPALTLLAALLLAPLAATHAAGKPNIIVILADDMGYADAGFNGCKDIPTPHLDSIAKNGIRFSSGYVSAPQCAPSRAGLLLGMDQNRVGCENNNVTDIAGLSEGTTFADHMRAAGYRTGMVGKWHLGAQPGHGPVKARPAPGDGLQRERPALDLFPPAARPHQRREHGMPLAVVLSLGAGG